MAAFILVQLLVDSGGRIRTIANVMIACGVFQAFFAGAAMLSDLEQVAFLDKQFGRSRATGTFINRNHLAGFLQMNLAIGIGMLAAQLHRHPAGNWREFTRRAIDTLLSRKFRLRLYLVIMVIGAKWLEPLTAVGVGAAWIALNILLDVIARMVFPDWQTRDRYYNPVSQVGEARKSCRSSHHAASDQVLPQK